MNTTAEELQKIVSEYCKTAVVSSSEDSEGARTYTVPGGKTYPSVTTILSAMADDAWLGEWISRVGVEEAKLVTDTATARGTSMHSLIENHFLGKPVDKTALGYSLYRRLQIYLQDITPLGLEIPLWSDTLKTAGRTDCLAILPKLGVSIVDYKSALREKTADQITDYFHQSALYAALVYERMGIAAKKIVILIGVDNGKTVGFPQKFVRNTSDYLEPAIKIVQAYHQR